MFKKRKQPTDSEAGRQRRPDVRQGTTKAPTYSYYANRRVESSPSQPAGAATRLRSTAEPPKQRWYTKKTVRFWAFVLVAVALAVELTFLSSSGRVTVIDASGNPDSAIDVTAYEKTFDGLLGSSILNRNKLTIDTGGIASTMQREHPELESVTVITPLIGVRPSLYIHVSEPVFTLKQDSSSYVLSAAGYITGRGAVSSLPVVVDETGEPVTVAKQLLPSSHVTFMRTVWYQLTKQGVALDTLVLPKGKAFELEARVKDKPYYLKFNVTEDATRQSGAAVAVLQQLGDTTPKEYIDLRVPGRAYYK